MIVVLPAAEAHAQLVYGSQLAEFVTPILRVRAPPHTGVAEHALKPSSASVVNMCVRVARRT